MAFAELKIAYHIGLKSAYAVFIWIEVKFLKPAVDKFRKPAEFFRNFAEHKLVQLAVQDRSNDLDENSWNWGASFLSICKDILVGWLFQKREKTGAEYFQFGNVKGVSLFITLIIYFQGKLLHLQAEFILFAFPNWIKALYLSFFIHSWDASKKVHLVVKIRVFNEVFLLNFLLIATDTQEFLNQIFVAFSHFLQWIKEELLPWNVYFAILSLH